MERSAQGMHFETLMSLHELRPQPIWGTEVLSQPPALPGNCLGLKYPALLLDSLLSLART